MGLVALREKKTYTDKTKLNPAARYDILRSKDTERLVCTVFIYIFFTSDPLALAHKSLSMQLSAVVAVSAILVLFHLFSFVFYCKQQPGTVFPPCGTTD